MNYEADTLRRAMKYHSTEQWARDNADAVAELVDAAIALHEENSRPGGWLTAAEERLARAVVDFKGPQGPPEPQRKSIEALLCPEEGCNWGRYIHPHEASDAMEHYRRHHHTDHGGRP